jgi:hypothetical protein
MTMRSPRATRASSSGRCALAYAIFTVAIKVV